MGWLMIVPAMRHGRCPKGQEPVYPGLMDCVGQVAGANRHQRFVPIRQRFTRPIEVVELFIVLFAEDEKEQYRLFKEVLK
ncbi:hypothetical protein D3C75_1144450 [compost metagenome]